MTRKLRAGQKKNQSGGLEQGLPDPLLFYKRSCCLGTNHGRTHIDINDGGGLVLVRQWTGVHRKRCFGGPPRFADISRRSRGSSGQKSIITSRQRNDMRDDGQFVELEDRRSCPSGGQRLERKWIAQGSAFAPASKNRFFENQGISWRQARLRGSGRFAPDPPRRRLGRHRAEPRSSLNTWPGNREASSGTREKGKTSNGLAVFATCFPQWPTEVSFRVRLHAFHDSGVFVATEAKRQEWNQSLFEGRRRAHEPAGPTGEKPEARPE